MAVDSMAKASTPEPVGPGPLWKTPGLHLPPFIQHIANDLREKRGMSESQAIQVAVGVVKKWAAGIPTGGMKSIRPDTVAAAQKAVAEWKAAKAKAHATSHPRIKAVELSMPDPASKLGLSHEQWETLPELFRAGVVVALGWTESAHPRAPKGQANGGKFVAGSARKDSSGQTNGQAAAAQKNQGAADAADKLMKMSPEQRQAYLDSLSDDELKALSAFMYSFKSADPGVVQGRTAIAGGLTRRGLNVNNYGGLGPKKADGPRPAGAPPVGGLKKPGAPVAKPGAKKPTVPGKKPAPPARKAAPVKRQPAKQPAPARRAPVANKPGATATRAQQAQAVQAAKARHATLNSSHTGDGLALAASSVMSGDGAAVTINAYQRRKLAASGAAMEDGSFPVTSKADLLKACKAIGRAPAAKRPAVRAHLRKRARELGVALPEAAA